jgi:hypothetical protein
MMKIVWSIICLQYFGSINKMNLKGVKWKHKMDSLTRITAVYGTWASDEYGFWGHAWISLSIIRVAPGS